MNQKVEPVPYPPRSEIFIFSLKFLVAASFVLTLLFIFVNSITIQDYSDQFISFFIESLIYYVIILIAVFVITYIVANVGVNQFKWQKNEKPLVKAYIYIGAIGFILLAFFQYQFRMADYPIIKDPYLLTGFAWTAVLLWWLLSLALGIYAIILFILKKVV